MEMRALWWLLLIVAVVAGGAAYAVRRRRALALARDRARRAVVGPTPEEEAYLDSSHIVGPEPGADAARHGGASRPRNDGR